MSTYIDSFILFILCAMLYPANQLNAIHILSILLTLSLYCFECISTNDRILSGIGLITLILCFLFPELTLFLPFYCYMSFYRKRYLLPALYILPAAAYFYRYQGPACFFYTLLAGFSFYLACQNRERIRLRKTIHQLRDNSVEQEMILKQTNAQLIASQNDQIYIATLKERNRIAREIHDSVGHMLSRSILQTGALLAICKDDTINPHLKTLHGTLNEAMNGIRNSVHDLHDESIDLKAALEGLVKNFTFCPVRFDCETSKHLPKEVKYCFLAITKEALNNIIKHSNATKVVLTVKEHPAFYQLLIEDNGTTGFHTSDFCDNSTGIGLTSMKDRVDAAHGILHISNENGFRVFVSVPK